MADTGSFVAADLARDVTIQSVTSHIVDVPTVRKHKLSSLPSPRRATSSSGAPRQRGRGHRRGRDARRPALERGKRREP